MNHEDRKRELAQKATPGPWTYPTTMVTPSGDGYVGYCIAHNAYDPEDDEPALIRAQSDAEHIAFHDPETALLEAEVIAALRFERSMCDKRRRAERGLGTFNPQDETEAEIATDYALEALDAHHAEREASNDAE